MRKLTKTEVIVPNTIPYFDAGNHEKDEVLKIYPQNLYFKMIADKYIVVPEGTITYTQDVEKTLQAFPDIVANFDESCLNIVVRCFRDKFKLLMQGYEKHLREVFGENNGYYLGVGKEIKRGTGEQEDFYSFKILEKRILFINKPEDKDQPNTFKFTDADSEYEKLVELGIIK